MNYLSNLPPELVIQIAEHVADTDPVALGSWAKTCWHFHVMFCGSDPSEQAWQCAVDRLWVQCANRCCCQSIIYGPFEPRIGTGGLYNWFCALVSSGDRDTSLMTADESTLYTQLERVGGPRAIAISGDEDRMSGLAILRELAERNCALPESLPFYKVKLESGMWINCLDPERPFLQVRMIDRHVGDIELWEPFRPDEEPFYLTRGELHIVSAVTLPFRTDHVTALELLTLQYGVLINEQDFLRYLKTVVFPLIGW